MFGSLTGLEVIEVSGGKGECTCFSTKVPVNFVSVNEQEIGSAADLN